jgi:hypothetical protein
MYDPSYPREIQELIKSEVGLDQRIVWSGMPVRTFFEKKAMMTFLFGIPWTAFAVFWTVSAGIGTISLKGGISFLSLFPLFGIPFILIGIAMLSAPLVTFYKSGKTAYVITNKKAFIVIGGRTTLVRSFGPEQLNDLFRRERRDGVGDIVLKTREWKDSEGDTQSEEFGFMNIRDVRNVEKKLKELASSRSTI